MQITYQKRDGSIIQKYRSTLLPYKIGDTTSMNWKVLNIEYQYNDKYYSEHEYNKLIHQRKQKLIKRQQLKDFYMLHIRTLMYYCIAVGIINLLKYILGI